MNFSVFEVTSLLLTHEKMLEQQSMVVENFSTNVTSFQRNYGNSSGHRRSYENRSVRGGKLEVVMDILVEDLVIITGAVIIIEAEAADSVKIGPSVTFVVVLDTLS